MTTNVTVVIGPPAAGKSTWILQQAHYGDIIVDFDTLAAALTKPEQRQPQRQRVRTDLLARVTLAAREAAIRTCLNSATGRAYIIHALPSIADLRRYSGRGARIRIIDPGRATVNQRISKQRQQTMRPIADKWYDELLPSYPPALLR